MRTRILTGWSQPHRVLIIVGVVLAYYGDHTHAAEAFLIATTLAMEY